jgi:hypothetical protein
MSNDIAWRNVVRRLAELKPWPRNPRQIKSAEAERLAESFAEFGQVETIAIGPDNEVYNGHQRLNVLLAKHGRDFMVECRQASRALTEKEREKLTIFLHKGAVGEWDFDILANEFEVDDLLEWGFKGWEIGIPEEVNDPNAEWVGMPEFEQKDVFGAIASIKVHFATLQDLAAFSELVGQEVNAKTAFIWYPKRERENLKAYVVKDES